MKKAISLVMVLMMCVCIFAGCNRDAQKETEPQVVKIFELENEKITAENVSPYAGVYLEYGDKETVSGVYAMKFTNTGDQTIQEAQLIFSDGTQELAFCLEMLPAGQSVIVAEQNQLTVAAEELQYVDGAVTYMEVGMENPECVKVDGGSGLAAVTNVTEEDLPLVRVFYRYTDENGNMIGGPCFSAMADGIAAGETIEISAEGWDDSCVVVTVLVINE